MFHSILSITLLAGMFLGVIGISPALAQEGDLPRDSTCIDCHLYQYQIFDSGKWYCLCQTPVRCTECHGGRTDTANQELAHEGLVPNPLVDQAARCQSCHPNDYQARVEKFASIAGIHSMPKPCPTCPSLEMVSASTESGTECQGGVRPFRALPAGPWQVAGISMFGIGFLMVFLFACRCWQNDQSEESEEQTGE
jgi:hypothetical protein